MKGLNIFNQGLMKQVSGGIVEPPTNWALSSNGATASALSTYEAGYLPIYAINGDISGTGWGSSGGWASLGSVTQWLQVDFASSKTITEIDVITVQDNAGSPITPDLTTTFALYGATAYDVQYWNGSTWVTITSVSSNNKIWRRFSFSGVTTTAIRINVTNSPDTIARLIEVEAWG